jgi:hypothetical protein
MAKPEKKDERVGGGIAPKTKVRVGPDRRAQATLRAANRPKGREVTRRVTTTTIKNPAVGIKASKDTYTPEPYKGVKSPTQSELGFNRYKPGDKGGRGSYATKKQREKAKPTVPTVDSRHKDRLRSAAVKHAMGRQLTDVRPGHEVSVHAIRNGSSRNARARVYENQTNGALNFERGRQDYASSTKLSKDNWQPYNTKSSAKFNPNTLKDSLKAMAQGSVVRATTKLIGGPFAQAAATADDAATAVTGKRPSKEIGKAHVKGQRKLIKELQIKKKKQAPWAGSGPF